MTFRRFSKVALAVAAIVVFIAILGTLTACGIVQNFQQNQNTSVTGGTPLPSPSPSPSASPSPNTTSSCDSQGIDATKIDHVAILIVAGSPGKVNSTDVKVSTTNFLTATPKDTSGNDVPVDDAHRPYVTWQVISGPVSLTEHYDLNPFNKDQSSSATGAYEIHATLCGKTGALKGNVVN